MATVNPLKVRLTSTYTVQLRGVTGKNTAGITLQGTYDSGWDAFVFDVLISGPYELWIDTAGGSTYVKDSIWSGATGKWQTGGDSIDSVN